MSPYAEEASPRQRAERVFDHLRHAAGEMIAAAQETLGLLDGMVSTADFGGILDTVNALSQAVCKRRAPPTPGARPQAPPQASGVERIRIG